MMSSLRTIAGVAVVVLIAAIAMAGCGGSDSDANEPEASKTFLIKGSQNKIPKFGEEADSDEREAASEVVEENFEAREAGEWAKQCSSLTAAAIKQMEEEALRSVEGDCPKDLKSLAEPLYVTKKARKNTLTGPIDALRVKGDRGWALYHGAKGKDYAIALEKVDDEWKVDKLAAIELK